MKILALFIGLASECGADMCYMHLVSKMPASSFLWWLRCVFHHLEVYVSLPGDIPNKAGRLSGKLVF